MISSNFYKNQDLADRELDRSIDLRVKSWDITDDIYKKIVLLYSEKHRRKSLAYRAKAMKAMSTSVEDNKLKSEFEKLSKDFEDLSNG